MNKAPPVPSRPPGLNGAGNEKTTPGIFEIPGVYFIYGAQIGALDQNGDG